MSKISFCAGVFDGPNGLHAGHLYLLREMRKLVGSDGKVIVGLNYDKYIIKKKNRKPLSSWLTRQEALAGTGLVDSICGFYGNPIDLILEFEPDYIVTGSDYKPEDVIGHSECREWGGKVVIINRIPGISTSQLIKDRENKETVDSFIGKLSLKQRQ